MTPGDAQLTDPLEGWCDVVGPGRMGQALVDALSAAGVAVRGPFGRGANGDGASVVVLCVPDREIATAAAAIATGPIVGHVSASAPMDLLEPHERFVMHPLLSVVGAGTTFAGATCAIDGSSPHALAVVTAIAERLGMHARVIEAPLRALYHASASAASNHVTTVLGLAESLGSKVGLDRAALLPLVQATVQHWAALGARDALTGPIARGDEGTVTRQRDAVAAGAAEQLPLWDALTQATRELAAKPTGTPK